jgi:hypothetical protein
VNWNGCEMKRSCPEYYKDSYRKHVNLSRWKGLDSKSGPTKYVTDMLSNGAGHSVTQLTEEQNIDGF